MSNGAEWHLTLGSHLLAGLRFCGLSTGALLPRRLLGRGGSSSSRLCTRLCVCFGLPSPRFELCLAPAILFSAGAGGSCYCFCGFAPLFFLDGFPDSFSLGCGGPGALFHLALHRFASRL